MIDDERSVKKKVNTLGKDNIFSTSIFIILGIFLLTLVISVTQERHFALYMVKKPLIFTWLAIAISYIAFLILDISYKLSSEEIKACQQYPWNTKGREILKKSLDKNKPLNKRDIKKAWQANYQELRRLRTLKKQENLKIEQDEEITKRQQAQQALKEKLNT